MFWRLRQVQNHVHSGGSAAVRHGGHFLQQGTVDGIDNNVSPGLVFALCNHVQVDFKQGEQRTPPGPENAVFRLPRTLLQLHPRRLQAKYPLGRNHHRRARELIRAVAIVKEKTTVPVRALLL